MLRWVFGPGHAAWLAVVLDCTAALKVGAAIGALGAGRLGVMEGLAAVVWFAAALIALGYWIVEGERSS